MTIWILAVLLVACTERNRPVRPSVTDEPLEEHRTLAASFVSRDTTALRALLHPDLIVQPPPPDTGQRSAAAVTYLLTLAAGTAVSESRLEPRTVVPEGPFVFEQGVWLMRIGTRTLRAPYTLRWRAAGPSWQVVLWRWGAFR
jgi:hypothetical protein